MIYLDSSVVLARLFSEDVSPPDDLWAERVLSSRLLEYEVVNRLFAYRASTGVQEDARDLLGRIDFLDLDSMTLARALAPMPAGVRTLDGMHLATMEFLRSRGLPVELATYDRRMIEAARAMGFAVIDL